jgi:hypothetical protein
MPAPSKLGGTYAWTDSGDGSARLGSDYSSVEVTMSLLWQAVPIVFCLPRVSGYSCLFASRRVTLSTVRRRRGLFSR